MNSPTHLAIAVATLGRRSRPKETKWIVWGALMPDLPMYVLLAFDLIRRVPMQEIWDERYFQDYWQIPLNFVNSAPIYLAVLILGMVLKWRGLVLFCAAALLHILFDLPLHREDAHAHLWPLSNWKFISPVSYWDPNHHGNAASFIEMIILLIATYFGARVFAHQWSKWLFIAISMFMPLAFLGFWIVNLLWRA